MKKNILKKFIVLFSLVFVLFGYNFAFAVDEVAPFPTPLKCVAPQVLNDTGDTCVDVIVKKEVIVCALPQVSNEDGDECIDLPTKIVVCVAPQILIGEVCTNPVVDSTEDNINIHLEIISGADSLYDKDISVIACDSDNDPITPDIITAYCAIKQLEKLETPILSDWSWYSWGSILNSINEITGSITKDNENKDVYHYWGWYLNGGYGETGLSQYELKTNDVILLEFIDPQPEVVVSSIPNSTSIHLKIISGTNLLSDKDISVTACDSDNNPITPDTITAYCAVLQSGLDSNWNWAWAPGAFVDSIGDIVGYTTKDNENKDVYHYWSWSANGTVGFTGLNEFIPKIDDQILLEFISPTLEVIVPVSSGGSSSGGSSSIIEEKTFSVENALSFLSQNQNSDGSFDSPMYTDWAAIAAKAGNDSNLKSSILNYLKSNPVNSSIITDHERRAMAIMALGINPYSGTEVNYINKIISAFDGVQIGDSSLYNDDIFGLIVLANSGYSKNDEIIKNTVSFIIKNQSSNGSWGSVDMTGAAISSLNNFKSLSGVNDAISKGELYLKSAQKNDGGFENPSSTSWAIQALSLNSYFDEEVKKAISYLATQQQKDLIIDNNIDINNRIWVTAYIIPAVLKLSWSDILDSFEKEEKNILIQDINVSDSIKVETEEILVEEKIEEPIIAIVSIEKEEMLTEIPIKEYKLIENKITQTNKLNNIENNINPNTSLQASAVLASENNNPANNKSFLSMVDQVIYGLKAPFVWFWSILSILL